MIEQAIKCYLSRRDRSKHPDGKFDHKGRWYPSKDEERECCGKVASPTKNYPYSLMRHCRTANHVARLFGVDVREITKVLREGGENYYKSVAVTEDGRFMSIYDGTTEYVIGQTLKETARQWHGGGYYVYNSIGAAMYADVPYRSRMYDRPRVILRVKAEGKYCRYKNKLAFSRVTPLEVVKEIQRVSTLKERMLAQIEKRIETNRIEIENYQKLKDRVEQFDGLEIEVSESDADVWMNSYGSATVNCSKPGLGQEVANCIALDLGVEFAKGFDERVGQHNYTGEIINPYFLFLINAEPPEDCKIEWVRVKEERVVNKAKVSCE